MSSLSPKDRVPLCSFTFADGRRCRSHRFGNHPRFCPDHAEKEARALATQSLGKDLDYFFSGRYLSACDLGTAMGRLIPAVIRGDVKPRTARTVAYLAQTLVQSIHISQHEYVNAFGTDGWRKAIRNSVIGNHDYRFPPSAAPPPVVAGLQTGEVRPAQPEPPASQPAPPPPVVAGPNLSRPGWEAGKTQVPHPAPPETQTPQPTPLPPTSAEFVQHVMAGLNLSRPARETGVGPAPSQAEGPAQPTSPSSNSSLVYPEQSEGPLPQHPRPAAETQTGPSGLPLLAALPLRTPRAS